MTKRGIDMKEKESRIKITEELKKTVIDIYCSNKMQNLHQINEAVFIKTNVDVSTTTIAKILNDYFKRTRRKKAKR